MSRSWRLLTRISGRPDRGESRARPASRGSGTPARSAMNAAAARKSAASRRSIRKSKTEIVFPEMNEWKAARSASPLPSATPADGFWSPLGEVGSRHSSQPAPEALPVSLSYWGDA